MKSKRETRRGRVKWPRFRRNESPLLFLDEDSVSGRVVNLYNYCFLWKQTLRSFNVQKKPSVPFPSENSKRKRFFDPRCPVISRRSSSSSFRDFSSGFHYHNWSKNRWKNDRECSTRISRSRKGEGWRKLGVSRGIGLSFARTRRLNSEVFMAVHETRLRMFITWLRDIGFVNRLAV